jgi:hypothetical protein
MYTQEVPVTGAHGITGNGIACYLLIMVNIDPRKGIKTKRCQSEAEYGSGYEYSNMGVIDSNKVEKQHITIAACI